MNLCFIHWLTLALRWRIRSRLKLAYKEYIDDNKYVRDKIIPHTIYGMR